MTKRELSKLDFETINKALSILVASKTETRAENLQALFASAHTGWLELEDEE